MEDLVMGDVVRLKSGGPKMVVHGIGDDGRVLCMWFKDGQARYETVQPTMLEKVDNLLGQEKK